MEPNDTQNEVNLQAMGVQIKDNKAILPDITKIKSQESYVLPSRGLLYEPSDNIPEAITLRRMTTKEEKIRLRNQTETEIIRDLLNACIVNEKVDAGNLKLVDANYLLFKLRVISLLDDTYKVRVRCPNCGTEFVHQLNLSEVPIKYVQDTDLQKMVIKLPLSQQVVQLKFPSLNDLINAGNKMEDYFKQFPNVDRREEVISRSQQLQIASVNGQTMLSEEKDDWYNKLDIVDYKQIIQAISRIDNIYGFEDNLKALCPKCGRDVEHGLPITSELFNPSIEDV